MIVVDAKLLAKELLKDVLLPWRWKNLRTGGRWKPPPPAIRATAGLLQAQDHRCDALCYATNHTCRPLQPPYHEQMENLVLKAMDKIEDDESRKQVWDEFHRLKKERNQE